MVLRYHDVRKGYRYSDNMSIMILATVSLMGVTTSRRSKVTEQLGLERPIENGARYNERCKGGDEGIARGPRAFCLSSGNFFTYGL